MSEEDVSFEDRKLKARKLQVWVTEETYEKILERTRATSRKASEWIRAVIDKHFAETETKKKREDGIFDRLERLLAKIKS